MPDWNTGSPSECGYYIAAWVQPSGYVAVSELWFNAYDMGGRWWKSRKYLADDPPAALWDDVPTVVGWMAKPEPPTVDDETVEHLRSLHQHKVCRARYGRGSCVCGVTPAIT